MPERKHGISARLLECAKTEFSEKGFNGASIRSIANAADTSPRAVYTRFPNKDGLFKAIVKPAADGFLEIFQESTEQFWISNSSSERESLFSPESSKIYIQLIDYAYDHLDEFYLLLNCSEGSSYSNFIDQLSGFNYEYIANHQSGLSEERVFSSFILTITQMFYASLFKPILQDMDREEAHLYIKKLCEFYSYGVEGIMGM